MPPKHTQDIVIKYFTVNKLGVKKLTFIFLFSQGKIQDMIL